MAENKINYDVAVIGGGPAGMMAAGRAAELGKKVILLEKNKELGSKLLLTGKGRCNITNAEFNLRKLVEKYGKNGSFLYRPFFVFGAKNTIDFFENRGLKTKIERGRRVFPARDRALDVLDVLVENLKKNNVEIRADCKILKIEKEGKKITRLITTMGEIAAGSYILCTGGKAYPGTGSTGDGFLWLEKLGHTIAEPRPSLVPIKIKEDYGKELQGLSLKNVEINVWFTSAPKFDAGANKKKFSEFGECLFAHFGLSGPIILDISKRVGELLKNGRVGLSLDLKPALDFDTLDKRICRDFQKYQNKMFKNSLDDLLPQKMIPLIIKLSGINQKKKVNSIEKEERQGLVKLLKGVKMTVDGLLGFKDAIVTSGGVLTKEIDARTMKSKIIDNLFFAGEIIDVDGPTGGFNLQICWSTGYLAGQSV
ncbi:MAG: NAD(P)/FAD-dependent oxidoreductase [Patescibacteria group bacterium]